MSSKRSGTWRRIGAGVRTEVLGVELDENVLRRGGFVTEEVPVEVLSTGLDTRVTQDIEVVSLQKLRNVKPVSFKLRPIEIICVEGTNGAECIPGGIRGFWELRCVSRY